MLLIHFFTTLHPLFGAASSTFATYGQDAGKSIALGVGAGGGAAGAGAGIGSVFGSAIQAKTPSPNCARTSSATSGSASR